MKETFEGMLYLHSIGVVHRDIKLENIMLTNPPSGYDDLSLTNTCPKIIDLGLACVMTPDETRADGYGTVAYCSPELLVKRPYNQATDVWSMGILLHAVLTGTIPFISPD